MECFDSRDGLAVLADYGESADGNGQSVTFFVLKIGIGKVSLSIRKGLFDGAFVFAEIFSRFIDRADHIVRTFFPVDCRKIETRDLFSTFVPEKYFAILIHKKNAIMNIIEENLGEIFVYFIPRK